MKRQLVSIGFTVAVALSGHAIAQAPPSGGELSQVFACFYECKPGPVVRRVPTWEEVTTLMVVNMNSGVTEPPPDTRLVDVMFLDGNENILGSSRVAAGAGLNLSPEDLDEIHVCRTLQANGLPVPQAGIVEFYVASDVPGGVYAWVKNLIGRFRVDVDEPFDGRVTGIAKTECRQVPEEVATPGELADKAVASGAPECGADPDRRHGSIRFKLGGSNETSTRIDWIHGGHRALRPGDRTSAAIGGRAQPGIRLFL